MKKQIIDALKGNDVFGKLGDAIINRVAEKLISGGKVKSEEDIEGAISELELSQVIESYADSRANDATKSAVANYEKKHNIKDGKPVQAKSEDEPAEKAEPTEDVPAWAKALMESNKALNEQLAKMKGETLATTRKGRINEALKDAPKKLRDRVLAEYARSTYADDEDFTNWLNETTEYAADISKDFSTPKPPTQPKSGGGGETASAGAQAYAERIKASATNVQPAQNAISGLAATAQPAVTTAK